MSQFLVNLIGGQVPGQSPGSFPIKDYDYEQYPASACSALIGVYNDRLYLVPSARLDWRSHKITTVYDYALTFAAFQSASNGDLDIQATREFRVGATESRRPTAVKLYSKAGIIFYPLLSSGVISYAKILTYPTFSNLYMYSDGFVQYSSRTGKRAIQSFDGKTIIDKITPKKYKVKEKDVYGIIAEESPPEVVESTEGIDGEIILGVNTSSILFALVDMVKKLSDEVKIIKEKIK